jgi:polar amino acid transport system substrate-binding protein
MKRIIHLFVLALAFALVATACGGGDDTSSDETTTTAAETATTAAMEETTTSEAMEETTTTAMESMDYNLVKDGTLTACSEIPYDPFEMEADDGTYTGFDVEMIAAVAEELGLEYEFIATGFDAITSGSVFAADQCDIAASAITITAEREESVNFSDPYFDADQSLLVKKDSGIASLDDMVGMNLGVQSTTTGEAYAQENAPDGVELVSYEAGADLFVALEAGNIAGILQDLPVNGYRSTQDDTVAVVATYPTGEEYGFALPETGKDELLAGVNAALAAMHDNGTYDEIFATWFGS